MAGLDFWPVGSLGQNPGQIAQSRGHWPRTNRIGRGGRAKPWYFPDYKGYEGKRA